MRLPFGLSSYSRANGRMAPVRLLNLYPEQSPTVKGDIALIQRPGLTAFLAQAARGLYREDGVLGGSLFTLTGTTLYKDGVALTGTVSGSDRPEWAYTVDGLFVLSGGVVYQTTNGTSISATTFPDSASVSSLAQLNSILVAVREDTGTIYFRLPGDTAWGALDYFSAEREPDPALAVWALGDVLYVFGSASIEIFAPTGDTGTPFQRLQGTAIMRGLKDRNSISQADNTLFFVAENNIAYRLGDGVPTIVSDNSIAARIELSTTASAFSYAVAGHTFWVLGLDDETLVLDVAGGWSQYTYNGGPFPSLGIYDGVTTYVAGAKVYTLTDVSTDDGVAIERLFTAVLPVEDPVTCDGLQIDLSPGVSDVTGEPAVVQMHYSDNQGRMWCDWRLASIGASGEYRKRVRYRRLGMADAPGRLFEVRITDPVNVRFSGVELNPPLGGRSR